MKLLNWLRDWPWMASTLLMVGICAADRRSPILLLSFALPLLMGAAITPRLKRRLLILLAFLLTGYFHSLQTFVPSHNADLASSSWKDHRLEGAGWIIGNPKRGQDSLSFLFNLERVEGHPQVAPLPIFVQVRPNRGAQKPLPLPQVALGQRWKVQGRLEELSGPAYPGDYDRAATLGRQGIGQSLGVSWGLDRMEKLAEPSNWVLRLRLRLKDAYARLLPPREAALMTGVVLGDPQELDEPLQQAFQRTGTSHLLSASGANVALIVAIAIGVGGLLGYGPKPLALPCLLLGLTYVGLAGFASSIVRAGWMAVFALGARALGREADGSRCLALGCGCYLLVDPAALFDIGFQLSAAAVLSLVLLERPFRELLPERLNRLRRALASGFAVLYGLAPLFVYHFQELNLAGVLGNLLIAAPVEGMLPVGLLQGMLALLPGPAAQWMCWLTRPWAGGCIRWVEFLALYLNPACLARPDLWCALAWLLGLLALLYPRRGGVATATLGLVCLACSQPSPPDGWSRCRLVSRFGKTVLWWSTPQLPDVIVLEDDKQLNWTLGMLRKHGCVRLADPLVLGSNSSVLLDCPLGLKVQQSPGALDIQFGHFRLVWKTFAPLSAGDYGATVLIGSKMEPARGDSPLLLRLPGRPGHGRPPRPLRDEVPKPQGDPDLMEMDLRAGPLEISTDGVRVSAHVWKEQSLLEP